MKTQAKLLVGKLLVAGLLVAPLAGRAQATADLEVSITPLEISWGQTQQYAVTIDNLGPSTAVGVEVAMPTVDADLVIVAVSGCVLKSFQEGGETIIDPNDARSWPCSIASIADFGSAEVTFDVFWPFPAGLPEDDPNTAVREDAPTTCPTSITLAASTVSVSTPGAGATTDPDPSNNTATDAPVSVGQAWLRIALTSDVASGGPGTQFRVTGTVTNDGPCTAAEVAVSDLEGVSDQKMSFVAGATTGCAEGVDLNPVVDSCTLGDLAPAGSAAFSVSYTVGSMGSDELQRATNVSLNAYSDLTFDPDESDNVTSVKVISSQDVGGCSTGGIPGTLGLLLLGLPLFRRRRSG